MIFRKTSLWTSARTSLFNSLERSVFPKLYPKNNFKMGYIEGVYRLAGIRPALVQCAMIVVFWSGAFARYLKPVSRLNDVQVKRYYATLTGSRWYLVRLLAYAIKSHALIASHSESYEV